jgi:hypothetical protein
MNQSDGRGKGPRKLPKKEVTTEFLLQFYEAFLREYEITKVAGALETTAATLLQWIEKFPELKEARNLAIQRRKEINTFNGYVFKHLSPEAKRIWERIQFWESNDSTQERIDAILSGRPTKLRQEIFVHALIHYSFNISEACRIACVSRATMERWRKDDYGFLQLLEEIEWHKCNFFEQSLIDLVAIGNPGAVMFCNRTRNADRGYTEKIQLEHTGQIGVGIEIDQLNLPIETRKQILQALREKKPQDVIDITPKQLVEDTE